MNRNIMLNKTTIRRGNVLLLMLMMFFFHIKLLFIIVCTYADVFNGTYCAEYRDIIELGHFSCTSELSKRTQQRAYRFTTMGFITFVSL